MEEKELIYRIQHGEKELLEELIQKYYDNIYRFCYYKTGNASISYDLTQETFLRLIKYMENYEHKGKLKNYIVTIAINVCNSYFYKNNTKFEELNNSCSDEGTLKELGKIEQKDIIMKALNRLPEKQKEVIILRYYEDLKIRDIAKMIDEKIPTVKSRLKQGIEKLNKSFSKEDFY